MQIIERLLSVIAPHYCIGCEQEGQLLCAVCSQNVPKIATHLCIRCNRETFAASCWHCDQQIAVDNLWAASAYEGAIKELLHTLKFGRAQAAAEPLARLLNAALPELPQNTLIVPLPTSTRRVRQRGYDQAAAIAKLLAKQRQLTCAPLLARQHHGRQVGASKVQRQQQAANAYQLRAAAPQTPVLLIDDVFTTGASMHAAANVLRQAGCQQISGAVIAYVPLLK